MVNQFVKIQKLREEAKLPEKATKYSAAYDLYSALDEEITVMPGQTKFIPLGFATSFDPEFVVLIFSRSGLATKEGLALANKVGVIDADYRGEWVVALHNHDIIPHYVQPKQRVAQAILFPKFEMDFVEVGQLTDTQRGQGGFGSTGT